jgi:hypothetical protein
MQLDLVLDWLFDLSEVISADDLEKLLADLPGRTSDLEALSRDQADLLATLGNCRAALLSNWLLQQPKYRKQRQSLLDSLTAAADVCRS